MGGQQAGALVLGYKIERRDAYDANGRLHSTRYIVRCPHSGDVIGHAQSLRMAKRMVLMRELREFDNRAPEQSIRHSFAA